MTAAGTPRRSRWLSVILVLSTCVLAHAQEPPIHGSQSAEQRLVELGVATNERSLLAALADPRAVVRMLAAELAGKRHMAASMNLLRSMLGDDIEGVRVAAASSLWDLGDRSGRTALVKLLESTDPLTRIQASRALCTRGDGEAGPVLERLATAPEDLDRGLALGVIGDCSSLSNRGALLARGIQDPSEDVRLQAVISLDRLETQLAVPFWLDALSDRSAQVRYAANARLEKRLGSKVGFDPWAPEAQRKERILRWRELWNRDRSSTR